MPNPTLIPPPSTVPPPRRGRLERQARDAWIGWGAYSKWTICVECRDLLVCRSRSSRGPFLCLDCWDQR